MLLAVLSDSHGDANMVATALYLLRDRPIDAILHCGDVGGPDVIHLFAGTPTHFVQGNCDHEIKRLAKAARDVGQHWHGELADLTLGNHRVAMTHGDNSALLQRLIQGGEHQYVFHGHTHQRRHERIGNTWVVNPGALHRAKPKTMALVDLDKDAVEFLQVAD